MALNTSLYPSDDEARAVIESIAAETGLPADDPVRFGADRLWPAVRDAVDGAAVGLTLTHEVLSLALRDPFRIARSEMDEGTRITTVIVELRDSDYPDLVGVGEGYPDRFYGETPETMAAVFPLLLARLESQRVRADPATASWSPASCARARSGATARPSARSTSRCTTSSARSSDMPVHVVRELSADIPPTDFTIGIDEPAVVAERARRAADFPALKIKCGGPADLATLRAVREVFAGPIRVDANTGWTRADAEALLPELVDLGVELIEQPFPARAYRGSRLAAGTLADADRGRRELRVSRGPRTARRAWCRREREAREVRRDRAAAHMLERPESSASGRSWAAWRRRRSGSPRRRSSRSMAEWIDLDGNLLLADDPFEGLELGPTSAGTWPTDPVWA